MKSSLIVSLFFLIAFNFFAVADNINFVNDTINNKSKEENSFLFGLSGFIQYGECGGTAIISQNGKIDNR